MDPIQTPRLPFVEGLRGLAALSVAFLHIYCQAFAGGGRFREFDAMPATFPLRICGQTAVDFFIVISGYCLMLPVAAQGRDILRGGLLGFLKRRARRILPPYYAALALSLLLIACVPGLRRSTGGWWDGALPAFKSSVIISHLLLIHNVSPAWIYKIDYPLWSIATEWQIYFLFALLLLPVKRRMGQAAVVPAAIAVVLLSVFMLPHAIDQACPHLLILFAFGMSSAVICLSQSPRAARLRCRVKWEIAACGLGATAACLALLHPEWFWRHLVPIDLIAGAAAACLLVRCYFRSTAEGRVSPSKGLQFLESGPVVKLGGFSYSLYLTHAPVIAGLYFLLQPLHWPLSAAAAALFALSIPLCLLLAFVFFTIFEKPFVTPRR